MQIDEMTFEHAEYGTFVWKDDNRDELQFFITNTEMKKLIKTLNKLKGLKQLNNQKLRTTRTQCILIMERQRKDNIKKGERTQRPFCFRLDNDLRERLSAVQNKGRFINDAIRDKLHTLGDV